MHNAPTGESPTPPPLTRAVIYARMSTEHQKYSVENQIDAVVRYAVAHGMEIIRSYVDKGKSGLRIKGRDSLKRLLADVAGGHRDFDVILVYDVTRWGRFQDADEGAHYEFVCRSAGVEVIYCAEQFSRDPGLATTLMKSLKRAIAGETSRDLSTKVFAGQCTLIRLGFRQGGHAGYGLRRMLKDQEGKAKGELHQGEQKSIQTDRVILVLGPDEEVETVRWIFSQFIDERQSELEIAAALNERGVTTDWGRPWTRSTVNQVLINEKYIGNNVFNRRSFKLKQKYVQNPEEEWVRANAVFEPLVNPVLFWDARRLIMERARRYTDDELITGLKGLYQKTGWLSALIIDECESLPSSCVYGSRFGGLLRAYKLVGYAPDRDYEYLEINRRLREVHAGTVRTVIDEMTRLGGVVLRDPDTDLISVNEEFTVSLVIARCVRTSAGSYRWNIRLDRILTPDITVAVRMDATNKSPLDYYLLPSLDMSMAKLRLAECNGFYLDTYRFDTLEYLHGMARRVQIEVA